MISPGTPHQSTFGTSPCQLTLRTLHDRRAGTRGAALVIVLSFVVLLVTMALAFFSSATSERQISDSSSNDAKVNLFAQGVGDQILGDLEQEIVAGSTNIGTTSNPVYVPKTFTNMIQAMPAQSGTNSLGGMPPNVLKRSAYNQRFYPTNTATYDTNGANRASDDSSTNATRAGRSVTLARWNASLLLPKTNSSTDFAPFTNGSNGFVAPDWIYVTAQGSNPVLTTNNLAAYTVTNSDPVIGRYAYVIYHEGGLLDMNVAGYPTNTPSTNEYIVTLGAKPVPAYVALTAIPGIGTNDSVTGATSLTNANQTNLSSVLVGWRNYASSGASNAMGTLSSPGYTFLTASNYFTNMIRATNGFLTTAQMPLNDNQSDRNFNSRQQLIQFLKAAAKSDTNAWASLQNALQYMGTFSRSLEQPSYVPPLWYNTNAPRITTNIGTINNYTDYAGGNNAFTNAFVADTNINVAFPRILSATDFTRNVSDLSGATTALPGEPLVKKRFPLERLAWLTYLGPSGGDSSRGILPRTLTDPDMVSLLSNPGVSTNLLAQGTALNIQRSFGLTWNTNGCWEYNPTSGGSNSIATLSSLAGTREPNFAELLKATISVGSLGKSTGIGGAYTDPATAWKIHERDTCVDHHVLRIMANIMDQADADGYPTTIRFVATSPNPTQTYLINGIENLPYIYRTRQLLVRAKEGRYLNTNGVVTNYPVAGSVAIPGTLVDQGVGVMLMVPEIWNPHDQNSSLGTPYPTNCRIIAENWEGIPTNFPATALNPANSNTFAPEVSSRDASPPGGIRVNYWSTNNTKIVPPGFKWPVFAATNLTPDNSALVITLPTNTPGLFRDPTSLHTAGIPSGSDLRLASTHMLQSNNFTALLTDPLFRNVVRADGSGVPEWAWDTNGRIGFYIGCVPLLSQFPITTTTSIYTRPAPLFKVTNTISNSIVTNVFCGVSDVIKSLDTATNIWGGISYTNTISFNSTISWEVATYHWAANPGAFTLRLQYADPITTGQWCDYDVKTWDLNDTAPTSVFELRSARLNTWAAYRLPGFYSAANGIDPRTGRFGLSFNRSGGSSPNLYTPDSVWMGNSGTLNITTSNGLTTWAQRYGNTIGAQRYETNNYISYPIQFGFRRSASGFTVPNLNALDIYSENNNGSSGFYTDPDGVIRRGMSAYATNAIALPTISPSTFTTNTGTLVVTPTAQSQSRPMILNRPFRSVAELGYVFSDLPWRHLNFFTPESGNVALLDTFCIRDQSAANGLSAGKVNLNTRQAPVLQAVMAGGMIDELTRSGTNNLNGFTGGVFTNTNVAIAPSIAYGLATNLVARTATNTLYNVSDLVGRWVTNSGATAIYNGFSSSINNGITTNNVIQRFREAPIRALANTGQTRVWNLMIDVVAQTGKFPAGASALNQFIVTGEKRLWLHVAIDRVTGQILDSSVETVNE